MNIYFITGTSSGIGYAIAQLLLSQEKGHVIGFSRTCNITHEKYKHITIDFDNIQTVNQVRFSEFLGHVPGENEHLYLINNAGILGDIGHVGSITNKTIENTYNINTLAPSILMNTFIGDFKSTEAQKTILNVSSGAAQHPVDGWAVYCASKAAIDMYSKVIFEELKLDQQDKFKIMSVGPGVVDTDMQVQIRDSNPNDFSGHQKFVDFKVNNELKSPENIASYYLFVLDNEMDFSNPVFSLRDLEGY